MAVAPCEPRGPRRRGAGPRRGAGRRYSLDHPQAPAAEKFPDEVVREAEKIEPTRAGEGSRAPGRSARPLHHHHRPDDAKDFDDAIEVQRTKSGWSVSVHIADVSHYVKPRTMLDREAVARGNSVYLADRVIPMLPEALSNGICSLKPGVDRLAFSVFADVTRQGAIRNVRFSKSVIRSAARLTYKQAFAILQKAAEGRSRPPRPHRVGSLVALRKKRFA